jgi:hypothetical protein
MHTTQPQTRVRAAACRGQHVVLARAVSRPAVVRTRAYLEEKQPGAAGQTAQGTNQLEGE